MWVYRPRYVPAYIPRRPFIPPPAGATGTCTLTYGTTFQSIDGFGVADAQDDTGRNFFAVCDQDVSSTAAVAGAMTLSESDTWAALLCTYKCSTAAALVQECKNTHFANPAASYAVAFNSNVTAGNFLILAVAIYTSVASAGTVTVTDSLSQTWNLDASYDATGVGESLWFFSFPNTAGGACTITLSCSGNSAGIGLFREYSGVSHTSPFDKTANGASSGTSVTTSNTATLSQATELVVAATTTLAGVTTITPGTGYGNLTEGPTQTQHTPISASLADMLFSPTAGIGLSIVRIGIQANGTTARTSAGLNLALAAARGAKTIFGTPWTPPPAYKSNGAFTGGNLNAGSYTAFSNYLATFASTMSSAGYPLYAISIQNEPDLTNGNSCLYTAAQMDAFMTVLVPILTSVKIMMPEQSGWQFNLAATAWGDANASSVGVVAAHNYGGTIGAPGGPSGARIWATEYSHLDAFDGSMTDGIRCATDWHDLFVTAGANAIVYWTMTGSGDNEALIQGDSATAAKRYYVLGNWSKFVRPGWVRINESDSGWGLCSAYKSSDGGQFAIVAINNTSSPVSVTFTLSGFSAGITSVTPYITDASNNLAVQTAVTVSSGTFTSTLTANSVTTFTGGAPLPEKFGYVVPFEMFLACYEE